MTKTLRVCYKRPGDFAQEREINNSLGALQNLVGGYIEVAKPFGIEIYGRNVIILCNEEGLLNKLPYNCMGLLGPVVWVGVEGEDFRSLTDEEVASIMRKYGA